jgi:dihydrofolate reductase
MAHLILAMLMSLDGYVTGPGGVFVGPTWSADLERHWAQANLDRAGVLLYGRKNFEFNRAFWTDLNGPAASIPHGERMHRLPKMVVSRSLSDDPGWNGEVLKGEFAPTIRKLKADVRFGDIVSFGGAELAQSLVRERLVNEYKLMVLPRLFGGGRRLFVDGLPPQDLRLDEVLPLDTGAVIFRYLAADS